VVGRKTVAASRAGDRDVLDREAEKLKRMAG
jgi:hypothetical protein